MNVCVITVDKGAKISFAIPIFGIMAKRDDVPDLTSALEKSFAEMKIGEENFSDEKVVDKPKESPASKISYGEKYTSENQSGKIIVKPIKATKKIIEEGVDIEILEEVEDLQENVVTKPDTIVIDSPTSTIGDDFAVEW
tara:strand:+ start:86 stop:502 length:417 start_codon:yes stop_codon:yes gene_type:complete